MSNDNTRNSQEMCEFNVRKKMSSCFNRLKFLKDCLAEQVFAYSAPTAMKNGSKPFSDTARVYLEEACSEIKDNIYVLKDQRRGIKLTRRHETKLKRLNEDQPNRLKRKLDKLCYTSKWKEVGNVDLVQNLSTRELSQYEKEALALGFKFDSGKDRYTLAEHIEQNYQYSDSEADKDFVQGILTCCKALADNEPSKLPRRYMQALQQLASDRNIIVT